MAGCSDEALLRELRYNASLEKYFTEVVTVNREKTKAISAKVLPNIERILQCVHDEDEHFEKEPVRVGSYTQGLGVNVKRDYDFNVVFRYNPDEESNSLRWIEETPWTEETTSYYEPNTGPDYCLVFIDHVYGHDIADLMVDQQLLSPLKVRERFRSLLENAIKEVDSDSKKNLKLSKTLHGPAQTIDTKVKTDDGVTYPVSIDLSVIIRAQLPFLPEMGWPVQNVNIASSQLAFQPALGRPVPNVNITRAQLAFQPALGRPVPNVNITRAQLAFQPALGRPVPNVNITRAQLAFQPALGRPVPNVNITRAQLAFQPALGRPVPNVKWPSEDKIQDIEEKGINVVAKRKFHWQLSFAELEKLLVREIDKDGGCQQKVHRIMKSVFYTVCNDKPTISTYILKNVWFHEIENFPYSYQWVSVRLGERYRSCLQRLIDCSRTGELWQYFYRRVNLLEGKNMKDISSDVEKICRFDFSPWQT